MKRLVSFKPITIRYLPLQDVKLGWTFFIRIVLNKIFCWKETSCSILVGKLLREADQSCNVGITSFFYVLFWVKYVMNRGVRTTWNILFIFSRWLWDLTKPRHVTFFDLSFKDVECCLYPFNRLILILSNLIWCHLLNICISTSDHVEDKLGVRGPAILTLITHIALLVSQPFLVYFG